MHARGNSMICSGHWTLTFRLPFQMYGENWKSPLPRFAANLGYNALEPLKPVAVDNSSINNNNNLAPSKSKESVNTSSAEPTIKMERSPEVPAAQFDWNSAGLVNPLDGMNLIKLFESNALFHTLNIFCFRLFCTELQPLNLFLYDFQLASKNNNNYFS